MTCDLYSTIDIRECRKVLLKEQKGLCAITGLPIKEGQEVLEHAHDSEMLVRGVASRQANSALGVIERAWVRYLRWWYPETLPIFLRRVADYIEKHTDSPDARYRHNSWGKRLKIDFNKLNSKQMKQVLETFGKSDGKNLVERKKIFSEIVLDRNLGYDKILSTIKDIQNEE